MAKQIFIPDDDIEKILLEIKDQIAGMKNFGSVNIKKSFTNDKRQAVIYFTSDAWSKLIALVMEFNTEVQWHGCVKRIDDNEFEVYDILVPPHTVTGATVTSDPTKYTEWINSLDDDVFNFLHFHGHSHVNMACSPSGTDTKYRQDVVTQLPIPKSENEDSFYIFLIFNKRGEWTGEIYDIKNNALYGTTDISIKVRTNDGFLSDFVENAKKMAVEEKAKVVVPTYPSYASYYGQYSSKGYSYKDEKKPQPSINKSTKHYYDCEDDGDEDDPTSPFYVGRGW